MSKLTERVDRSLARFPTLHQVAANAADPTSRGQRLRVAARTFRYELQTGRFKRPMTLPLGARSKIIAYPGETNSPNACRNPPNVEMVVWQRILKPGDVFFDVGANIGIYTILACERGADVTAFEPDAHNADRVRQHLALNGYEATVVRKAAADKPGVLRFTQGLDSYNHLADDGDVEIEATTLDDVIRDRRVTGMKIDVEGSEHLVLAGAARALSEHRIGVIQMEWDTERVKADVSGGRAPVAELLRASGYLLHRLGRDGRLHRTDDPGSDENVFAAPIDMTER